MQGALNNLINNIPNILGGIPKVLAIIGLLVGASLPLSIGLNYLAEKEYKPKKKGQAHATHKSRTKVLRLRDKLGKRDNKRHNAG